MGKVFMGVIFAFAVAAMFHTSTSTALAQNPAATYQLIAVR
jgi:hypothetical protein